MKLPRTSHHAPSTKNALQFSFECWILLLLISLAMPQSTDAQQPETSSSPGNSPLSAEQIVEKLVGMNLERARALHAYQGTRTYRVEYKGFPGARSAEMVVAVRFQSPGTKEFTVKSTTGSKLIIEKVFKKLLEAEQGALAADAQRRTALNEDNYEFTLIAYETDVSGAMYLLKIEPRSNDKFLCRGRIWVDADDFAVVRLEAEPAKNPSFWTRKSEIEQVYIKVDDFWLPAHNRSVSAIRLGGHAELTIEYNDYQITGAQPVGRLSTRETTRSADTNRRNF